MAEPEENDGFTSLTTTLAAGDSAAIIDVAQAAAEPTQLDTDEVYSVVAPVGAGHHLVDLQTFKDAPRRHTGSVKVSTVESLIDYVTKHDAGDATTVWVEQDTGVVVAVLNDHDPEIPGWGDHRANLALQHTDEWLLWRKNDGELLSQEAFAEHLEDGVKELVAPDAATMLEIAQSISVTNNAQFRSRVRLDSGEVGFHYDEKIEGQAGEAGDIVIPREFKLAISPFVGEDPYEVTARLRYRVNSGRLTIGYKLERPADVVRDCLEKVRAKLDGQFDRVYIGSPR